MCIFLCFGPGSSIGIVTRNGMGGPDQISVGAIFAALVRTCPGAQPASYTMGTGSFLDVQQPERGVNQPHPI